MVVYTYYVGLKAVHLSVKLEVFETVTVTQGIMHQAEGTAAMYLDSKVTVHPNWEIIRKEEPGKAASGVEPSMDLKWQSLKFYSRLNS